MSLTDKQESRRSVRLRIVSAVSNYSLLPI